MEAVPRLPMLQFPVKSGDEAIHFNQILKQGIRMYYEEDPESYNAEIHELENLRRSVLSAPIDFSGCSLLKRYYCQLYSLCSRFPLDKMENEIFQWSFGFEDSNKTGNIGNITYEMNSVMYNIAAFHMSLGEEEMRNAPKGMKIACTHFQCAAWAFETLSESKLDDFEITSTGMIYLKYIALSQAQECILEKSMTDSRKPNIIAKVSMQVVEYLKVSQAYLEIIKKQPKYANLPKVWEPHIKFKLIYYHAITLFYLGMQSDELQKIGEKIAYFEAAFEKFTEASKCTKPLEKLNSAARKSKIRDSLTFANDVIQGKLTAGKKENDFVYHEKVPPFATLPEAKGASLVKCIPFRFTDPEVAGADIFQRLVPIEAHQASSVYSEEKAKLLRQVASQIEERNVELESYLSSMQLDSFVYENDESLNVLPQELVECCADLNSRNAYRELSEAMSLISNAQHEVDMKLGQIQSLLMQEEEQEKQFSTITGTKQAPSQILNELKREVKRCKDAHQAAQDTNNNLHTAITTHKDNIAKLSNPLNDLMASLPSAVMEESEGDREVRHDIQRLMKKVRDMKTQRADFETQLRIALQEDDITRELVVNQGNIEELFKLKLQKHSSIVSVLEQNMCAQPNILNALSEANANYAATRKSINVVRSERSDSIYSLIASYQAFMNIVEKVESGKDFYSKMEVQLNKALTRAKSLCKVQEEQREEKLAMNVKRFAAGYNPPSNNPTTTAKEPLVPSGPKLKDYLMAGNEVKSLPNPTPAMGTYASDYGSSSSVRPSPVGSEIQDKRTINMSGYASQIHSAQTIPYQPPYSQTNPNQVTTPQPLMSQSNVYHQPLGPQSTSYQAPVISHLNYNQASQAHSLPRQIHVPQHVPQHVPVPQSSAYAGSAKTAPYQAPVPQTTPFPISISQSIPYSNSESHITYQQTQGTQLLPSQLIRPKSLGYQIPSQSTPHHNIRGQPKSIQHPGMALDRQNPVSQFAHSRVNAPPSFAKQVGECVPPYQHEATVTPMVGSQATGPLASYQTTSHSIPYQTLSSGSIPQAPPPLCSTPQTYSNEASYKSHNYPGQQANVASYPYSAKSGVPTTLPYNYSMYANTGAHTLAQSTAQVTTLPFSQPSDYNVRPSQPPTAIPGALVPNTLTYSATAHYPNKLNQQPSMIHPNDKTGHQLSCETPANIYQRAPMATTPRQPYPAPCTYIPQSNLVYQYQAPTYQTIPRDSYSQKYLPQYTSMQVASSNSSAMGNCDIITATTSTPVNGATSVNNGQYANQRYVPSGFGNYPNWSATNTNTVSFNPMTSSIPSPGAQPKINAGTSAGINVLNNIRRVSDDIPLSQSTVITSSIPPGQKTAQVTPAIVAKEGFSSNLDLLAGIDITQTMAPLLPQHPTEDFATISANELNDTLHKSMDDLSKMEISSSEQKFPQTDESILAKLAQQPKRSTSTLDPLSAQLVLSNLATETERFSKFVLGLNKKSLNGPTNLELKWSELANIMDFKCSSLKISVSRCYPLKNRFADLLPFDSTRVVLPSSRDDYINASYVRSNLVENSIPFIMTQAPMPHTFTDFWSMVWDNQVETVVCLNIEAEVKGQIYYPTELGHECNYGHFSVVAKQICKAVNSSWIRRTFHITERETKVTKVILHCQFVNWPPGEMPESPSQFLQFIEEFHALHKQQRNKMNPSVLHCISGTGRSGAFAVVSVFIQHLIQTGCLFDIWALIVELCQQRRSALQDKAYLLFLYSSALYYAQDILMKRGILTDKATFEDNPRHKTHVRHPSADLLTSDLSKMKVNLGLDASEPGSNYDMDLSPSPFVPAIGTCEDDPVGLEATSNSAIQIGGATLPPNLAASVDPQQLTIDATKKAQKMTKEQFTTPSTTEADDVTHPFQKLDPLWSQRHI